MRIWDTTWIVGPSCIATSFTKDTVWMISLLQEHLLKERGYKTYLQQASGLQPQEPLAPWSQWTSCLAVLACTSLPVTTPCGTSTVLRSTQRRNCHTQIEHTDFLKLLMHISSNISTVWGLQECRELGEEERMWRPHTVGHPAKYLLWNLSRKSICSCVISSSVHKLIYLSNKTND